MPESSPAHRDAPSSWGWLKAIGKILAMLGILVLEVVLLFINCYTAGGGWLFPSFNFRDDLISCTASSFNFFLLVPPLALALFFPRFKRRRTLLWLLVLVLTVSPLFANAEAWLRTTIDEHYIALSQERSDPRWCEKIYGIQFKERCYERLVGHPYEQAGTPSKIALTVDMCNRLSDLKVACLIDLAVQEGSVGRCSEYFPTDGVSDYVWKITCMKAVARITSDYGICAAMDIAKYPFVRSEQAECYYRIAGASSDIEGCKRISGMEEIFGWCVNEVVARTGNTAHCAAMAATSTRSLCLQKGGIIRQGLASPETNPY